MLREVLILHLLTKDRHSTGAGQMSHLHDKRPTISTLRVSKP